MTYETKYLIDLSDILGIELSCRKCKGRILLEREAERRLFTTCPLCGETWLEDCTEEEKSVRLFVNLLRATEDALKGRRFSLKLQVAKPPQDKSHV